MATSKNLIHSDKRGIIVPKMTYEVNNVCFSTGSAIFDDTLYVYYRAADERIACASMSLSELLKELMLNKKLK